MDVSTHCQNESRPSLSQHVEVWFGRQRVCEHSAAPTEAREYADAMVQRFRGLRITIDDRPYNNSAPPLPSRRMWPFTVK